MRKGRKSLQTRGLRILSSKENSCNVKLREGQIVAMVLSGHTQKFKLLVDSYEVSVFNLVSRVLRSREQATDVAQEAFINAYKSLATYDQKKPFGPWIMKIAQNCAFAALRKQGKLKEMEETKIEDLDEFSSDEGSERSPQSIVERKFEMSLIESVLSELKEGFQSVIVLRHQEQMKQGDIARILDIPIGTVKSRLNYAYSYMRKRLLSMGLER